MKREMTIRGPGIGGKSLIQFEYESDIYMAMINRQLETWVEEV